MIKRNELDRREFLRMFIAAGVAAGISTPLLIRQALAMAPNQMIEGMRRVQGTVLINTTPAQVNSLVVPGDVISTGPSSLAVFVVGADAFLVRENSKIELSGAAGGRTGAERVVRSIKVTAGKLLSVFGKAEKSIQTVTAVAGVRGTGLYLEAEKDSTYICLCYGTADLTQAGNPDKRESLTTKHHEAPRYILGPGCGTPFLKAPMMNHTDAELIMLEELVGRKPPFGSTPVSLPGY